MKNKYPARLKIEIVERLQNGTIGLRPLAREYGIDSASIHLWWLRYQYHGRAVFSDESRPRGRHSGTFKLLVLRVMQEQQLCKRQTVALFHLSSVTCVTHWERLYSQYGMMGLYPTKHRHRRMKKPPKPTSDKSTLTLEQQLKRQQEELAYLRAENAYLKKLDALMQQKSGKKSRSSKH